MAFPEIQAEDALYINYFEYAVILLHLSMIMQSAYLIVPARP